MRQKSKRCLQDNGEIAYISKSFVLAFLTCAVQQAQASATCPNIYISKKIFEDNFDCLLQRSLKPEYVMLASIYIIASLRF